jgi:hypothetical protein
MRSRCNNPNNTDYAHYGARGIRVCSRWDDFAKFFADMGDRPRGLTLDRIDVHGDYRPDNCRWASRLAQANNRRSNRVIEIDGVSRTLQQWCDVLGVEQSRVSHRLARGMPPTKAFSTSDFRCAR